MYRNKLGKLGEAAVVRYIRRHGGVIVGRNIHYRAGELDIVAWWNNQLCFIEVKTRRYAEDSFGGLEEAITEQKLERWELAAEAFLQGTIKDYPTVYLVALVLILDRGRLRLRILEV